MLLRGATPVVVNLLSPEQLLKNIDPLAYKQVLHINLNDNGQTNTQLAMKQR